MRWFRRSSAVIVMVLLTGAFAGCGDDGSQPTSAPTTAPAGTGDASTTSAPPAAAFTAAEVTRDGESLTIAWQLIGWDGPVEISWGRDPGAVSEPLETVDGATSTTVDDPAPGGRAFFRLAAGDEVITVAERRVALEGVPNFRDLGGYQTEDGRRVRWGQLYRSGALGDLTTADLAVVHGLDIALVCDLRSDSEVAAKPDPEMATEAVRLAVNDESVDVQAITDAILAGDLDQISPTLLLEGMPVIATDFTDLWSALLLRISDETNRPTNVHCTAGKDRAGWASALVLRSLGVPETTVMEDYLLSNEYLTASNEKTIAQVRGIVAAVKQVPEEQVDMTNLVALLDVRAEYLQAAFDAVDAKFGSFDAYLTDGLGLTSAQVAALRDSMLE